MVIDRKKDGTKDPTAMKSTRVRAVRYFIHGQENGEDESADQKHRFQREKDNPQNGASFPQYTIRGPAARSFLVGSEKGNQAEPSPGKK